ncbi:PPP family 3-phenylpropionic acid transporter [Paenibacillus amylolyticus]|uniref:PPP family 3-phenylpropionic acid transporter n=1 Tax=Paenibacillus amylolyticus TaxID=1451 RepID=A0AAP5LNL2_PAEAM|nr:MFS transporter [Paenibacillus amylolyticus]MDR6723785.1 PPP family 3-phenylpropionic acid transporter [Paenibacillus amylolyticus]
MRRHMKAYREIEKADSNEARHVLMKLQGLYLFMGLAGGIFNPYINPILVAQGFSSKETGFIMAFGTLISIILQPIWGIMVDKFKKTRFVLVLSLLVPALLAYFYNIEVYIILILIYTLCTIFQVTQIPVADSYAVTAAKAANTSYGMIRLFGSLGTGLGGFAAGIYLSQFSIHMLWLPFLVFNVLSAILASTLPRQTSISSSSVTFSVGLARLLRNRTFLLFLIGCFLVNQTLTAFNSFFVISFQMAGGSVAMTGTALLLASITNVPSMLVAAFILRKWGHERTMLLAAGAYMLRWGIQWLWPTPEVMIGIQVLHGLSFGFFYIAAVEYVASVTGREMQATGQSLFNMVFAGLGGIVGNMLNGYLLDSGGPSLMYLACTISAALGAFILFFVSRQARTQQSLN